jgi:hypothetical protein
VNIKSQKDFFSGLMFMVVGGAFAIGATNYNMGSGARMGPGLFPIALGFILVGLGLVIAITSMVVKTPDGEKIGSIAWRPLVFIIAANLIFGVALGGIRSIGLPPMGMIAGIYALTFIACNAGDKFIWKEALLLATVLSVMSYAAFILLLKLQFPVWPPFFIA